MRKSLVISFLMHLAVVVAAVYIVLPAAEKPKGKKEKVIPVEIVTLSDKSRLTAKSEDKKEEKKPKPKLKPKPKPKPKPKKKVEPKQVPEKKQVKVVPPPLPKSPEPKVETPQPPKLKKVEKKPEPKKKETKAKLLPKSVPIPRVRPKFAQIKPKKETKFDTRKIAALLNKLPEDKSDPTPEVSEKPKARKTTSRFSGRDAAISASEKDLLKRRIGECWSTPVGVKDAEKLIVRIKVYFRRDGTLKRAPEVLNSTSEIAADRALRAIRQCEPYDMLSPKTYSAWREVVINFDPSEMFGG